MQEPQITDHWAVRKMTYSEPLRDHIDSLKATDRVFKNGRVGCYWPKLCENLLHPFLLKIGDQRNLNREFLSINQKQALLRTAENTFHTASAVSRPSHTVNFNLR
jgi:hypothetical protein